MMGTIAPSAANIRTNFERKYNECSTLFLSRWEFCVQIVQTLKYLNRGGGGRSAYFLRAERGTSGDFPHEWKGRDGARYEQGSNGKRASSNNGKDGRRKKRARGGSGRTRGERSRGGRAPNGAPSPHAPSP